MKRFLSVAIFACLLNADTTKAAAASSASSIRIPLLGFAVNASPLELRPIAGRVGADILGDALALPSGITAIMPAPGQQYALTKRGGQGELGWIPLDLAGPGDFRAIPGGLANADRVSFSPNGSTAILWASAPQRLQILTGLPDSPRIMRDIDGSTFAATLAAIAVSNDAAVVLLGFTSGDSGLVALIGSDGAPQTILNVSSISAIRFLAGSHDAVVADSGTNQVTLLSSDSFSPRVLAGDAQGVSTPLDVETSTDGSRVYVANSGAHNVLMIDVATGSSTALTCGFGPAAFARLMKSVVSVKAQDGDGVWVMDTDAAAPWVAFAPKLQ